MRKLSNGARPNPKSLKRTETIDRRPKPPEGVSRVTNVSRVWPAGRGRTPSLFFFQARTRHPWRCAVGSVNINVSKHLSSRYTPDPPFPSPGARYWNAHRGQGTPPPRPWSRPHVEGRAPACNVMLGLGRVAILPRYQVTHSPQNSTW